jgi:hypothetical protein
LQIGAAVQAWTSATGPRIQSYAFTGPKYIEGGGASDACPRWQHLTAFDAWMRGPLVVDAALTAAKRTNQRRLADVPYGHSHCSVVAYQAI